MDDIIDPSGLKLAGMHTHLPSHFKSLLPRALRNTGVSLKSIRPWYFTLSLRSPFYSSILLVYLYVTQSSKASTSLHS